MLESPFWSLEGTPPEPHTPVTQPFRPQAEGEHVPVWIEAIADLPPVAYPFPARRFAFAAELHRRATSRAETLCGRRQRKAAPDSAPLRHPMAQQLHIA